MGKMARIRDLRRRMAALVTGSNSRENLLEGEESEGEELAANASGSNIEEGLREPLTDQGALPHNSDNNPLLSGDAKKKSRRLDQKLRVARFFTRWQEILPGMQKPLMEYLQETARKPAPTTVTPHANTCGDEACVTSSKQIVVLFWDRE